MFYKLIKLSELKRDIKLEPNQVEVSNILKKQDGLVVVHGLGSGKTLASIAASESIGNKTDVIVPASLRNNFKKEINKWTTSPSKFNVGSYDSMASDGGKYTGSTLILDEAHRIRNEGTKRSQAITDKINHYNKRILLTGTPIYNAPSDLVPLINVAAGRKVTTPDAFNARFIGEERVPVGFFNKHFLGRKDGVKQVIKNEQQLTNNYGKLFDFYKNEADPSFPRVTKHKEFVEMTPHQNQVYNGVLEKDRALAYKVRKNLPPSKQESKALNSFSSAVRQVSDTPAPFDRSINMMDVADAPKIKKVINSIKAHKNDPSYKAVVYSNYLDSGVNVVGAHLKQNGVQTYSFTGGMSDKQRKLMVDDYNAPGGRAKALLLSSAGGEGLDLKGTTALHVLEPHWNDEKINQVIGRVARLGSHTDLPTGKRKVDIYQYYAIPRKTFWQKIFNRKSDTGIDEYLQNMSNSKTELNNQFLTALKKYKRNETK